MLHNFLHNFWFTLIFLYYFNISRLKLYGLHNVIAQYFYCSFFLGLKIIENNVYFTNLIYLLKYTVVPCYSKSVYNIPPFIVNLNSDLNRFLIKLMLKWASSGFAITGFNNIYYCYIPCCDWVN